jgi:hypothetical protein
MANGRALILLGCTLGAICRNYSTDTLVKEWQLNTGIKYQKSNDRSIAVYTL